MMLVIFIIIMTLLGACASFFLKKASGSLKAMYILKNKFLYIGGTLYLLSAFLNIYILQKMNYSVVLPLTSITYIWTMFLSYYFLDENVSRKKIIGVLCILVGSIVISQ